MSHADNGTLHAYLDGELSALEATRLESHLAECAPCRARLDEERDVVTRSTRLLGFAEPPERAAPPLDGLRQRGSRRRIRVPLTVAASLVLAVAAGWFAVSRSPELGEDERTAALPTESTVGRELRANPVTAAAPGESQDAAPQVATQPPQVEPAPATARAVPAPDTFSRGFVDEGRLERARTDEPSRPSRDSISAAPPMVAGARAEPQAAQGRLSGAETDGPNREAISVDSARALLNGDVFAVLDIPVRAVLLDRTRRDVTTVIVEQEIDSIRNIEIVHRRPRAGQDAANAQRLRASMRIQRNVGSTEIEVIGPLPADSLATLLGRLRAIR